MCVLINFELLIVNCDTHKNHSLLLFYLNICRLVSKLIAKDEELESAKKDKAAEELIRKEKTKEVSQLMDRLKEEQEKNSAMMKTVEAAKIEARKQSVLSLEMQDYEVFKLVAVTNSKISILVNGWRKAFIIILCL